MISATAIILVLLGLVMSRFHSEHRPVFPVIGGGQIEVHDSTRGSTMTFHYGAEWRRLLHRVMGSYAPARLKTSTYSVIPLGTNSLGVLLSKPITAQDFIFNGKTYDGRTVNGTFSMSLLDNSGREYLGTLRQTIFVVDQVSGKPTSEEIVFEFTNATALSHRLRMYQTNALDGSIATKEIHFTAN